MNTHMIDSAIYKDLYASEEMRHIFSDKAMLEKWILIEVTLAEIEAELGIIPFEAAVEIKNKGIIENFNFEGICKDIIFTSHPLVPFIKQYQDACDNDLGEYIHYGATTQDIIDMGLILQLKDGYQIIMEQVEVFLKVLEESTIKYKSTIMAGRTHGQHALPITFGYKIATWLAEMRRNKIRLKEIESRVFVGQLSGAAGTLASLGEHGLEVQKKTIERLGLNVPLITWHANRDNLVELANVYSLIAGLIGKIANEIINLQRTEVAEVEEGFVDGKIGSSTMPHKRNPMICEYVVGLSRLIRMQLPVIHDSLVQEHERDMGLWLVELEVMPEISIYLSKILSDMTSVVQNMKVYEERMYENLFITNGLIISEKLMFEISKHIGKQTAHEIVYKASMRTYETKKTLAEEIMETPEIQARYTKEQIETILDPKNYLGLCKTFIDQVLESGGS